MSNIISDEQLVEYILIKDKEYFSELIDRYQVKLTRYIRRITNVENEDVEDILQNSFIRAYQNLHNFDSSLKFSSWIYRIVHNEVIDIHRKTNSKGRDKLIGVDEYVIQNIRDDFNAMSLVDTEIFIEHTKRALSNINHKYRDVIVLRYFEERDYREISDILKKPMNTVATLLSRAKKQLRKELNVISNNLYEHEK